MRRLACAILTASLAGGCVSSSPPNDGSLGHWGKHRGDPYAMQGSYGGMPPMNPMQAQQMMGNSIPLNMVQMQPGALPGMPPMLTPAGLPTGPGIPMPPGMPGGLQQASYNFSGATAAMANGLDGRAGGRRLAGGGHHGTQMAGGPEQGGGGGGGGEGDGAPRLSSQRTQMRFVRPSGMKVSWYTQGPSGPSYSTTPIEAPGRYNFMQGAIYRLKISNIEGRPGLEVYPTMEVVPCNPKTDAFLAHSSVPIDFTAEDFKQIHEGNYVVKVIYLPDPQFQDAASTGTEEILSTRLEPGTDPIQEALRRGSILAIIRMGNVDQEAPNTPPLGAGGPNSPPPGTIGMAPQFMPANLPPGMLPPQGMLPPIGAAPAMRPSDSSVPGIATTRPSNAPLPPPPPINP